MDGNAAVSWSFFKKQNAAIRLLGQARGKSAACRSAANDDVILFCHLRAFTLEKMAAAILAAASSPG
jgi:hypothetical protein